MKFFRRILKTDKNFTKTPWKTAKKLRTVTWWEQTQSIEKAKKTKFILKKKTNNNYLQTTTTTTTTTTKILWKVNVNPHFWPFSNLLLIFIDLYQHQALSLFFLEIDLKILQSHWLRAWICITSPYWEDFGSYLRNQIFATGT